MARVARRPPPTDRDFEQTDRRATSVRTRETATGREAESTDSRATSTSPTDVSVSSDKENRTGSLRNVRDQAKMSALSDSTTPSRAGPNKRRRLGEQHSRANSILSERTIMTDRTNSVAPVDRMSRSEKRKALNDITDTSYYDPEQDQVERRKYRQNIVDLGKTVADNKQDYLQDHNSGLLDTLKSANKLYSKHVKQTADAALDARLLVTTGDLAAKRSAQTILGATEVGVDVDEFVSKCAAFMRRGPDEAQISLAPQASQRRRAIQDGSDSEAEMDDGDELNWPWLGLKGAFPMNIRPPVPGFLLGPLSVQKKTRTWTQRKARQERRNPADATRPDELKPEQIEKQANANLTLQVQRVFKALNQFIDKQGRLVNDTIEKKSRQLGRELTDAETELCCHNNFVSPEGGANLFRIAFNPRSFGQTVENLFYIAFLLKESKAGISIGTDGQPYLDADPGSMMVDEDQLSPEELVEKRKEDDKRARNAKKNQSIIHIDFDTWKDACESYNITECAIGHREEDGGRQLGENGWYA